VSATLSAEDIQIINEALDVLQRKLSFMVSLTAEERQRLAKMGNKSVSFDEKCNAYMETHPQYLPGFIQHSEVIKDRELRLQLTQIFPQVQCLCDSMRSTLAVLNSEVWLADLAYYHTVRAAMKRGLHGAASIFHDLRQRFLKNRASELPTDEQPPTDNNPVK